MAIERVTGDAAVGDVVERVLDNGVMVDLIHSSDDDDDRGRPPPDTPAGAAALLDAALEPQGRPPSRPERTRRKTK
jgi:hypothetical protein